MTPWILPDPLSRRGRGDNFCNVYRVTNPDGNFESSHWSVTANYFPPQGLHRPTGGFRIPCNCELHIPMLKLLMFSDTQNSHWHLLKVWNCVGSWKYLATVFVKDARARQEMHCKIIAWMEIKSFQVGFAPRSRAFNAHWPSKPSACSELAWRQQAKFTAFCFCLKRSSFCQKLLAPNQTTFSQLPLLLPFPGFQRVIWNKLH